jgi:hypothetical protein
MDSWCYALINNCLGEIYFTRNRNGEIHIDGHAYLYPHERWTIRDVKEMQHDIPNHQFTYYRKKYRKTS